MRIEIRELRPGTFRLRYRRANMRAQHKTVYGTRADAEAACAIWAKELETFGPPALAPSATLASVINGQLALAAPNRAPGTLDYYRRIVRLYIDPEPPKTRREKAEWGNAAYSFSVGRKQVGRITPQDGHDFQNHLIEKFSGSGNSGARSINEAMRLCLAALDYCVRLRVIAVNPWKDIQRVRPRDPDIHVPTSEADQIAIQRIPGRVGLLLRLALVTNARRGELLGLVWNRVDLEAAQIDIQHSLDERDEEFTLRPPKSRAGRRTVSLPPEILPELRAARAAGAEAALAARQRLADRPVLAGDDGGFWSPAAASQAARRALHAAGVKTSLHALRHAGATLLFADRRSPEAVRRRLGHASVATTLRYYAHAMVSDEGDAAATLGRVMRKAQRRVNE